MTYAKKLIVPTLCVLLGCAGGAAVGNVTAQTWPEPANVQRWQQECDHVDVGGTPGRSLARTNEAIRVRGEAGWELVSNESWLFCFKRPAP